MSDKIHNSEKINSNKCPFHLPNIKVPQKYLEKDHEENTKKENNKTQKREDKYSSESYKIFERVFLP